MNEETRVQQAVLASQRDGTLTPDLITLVTQIVHRRCCPMLEDDIRQHVLLGLLRHLHRIEVATSYEYLTSAVLKTWQNHMRNRSCERRYLLWRVSELIDDLPPHARSKARGTAYGSFLRLKYY